jgi:hypothetical protein
VRISIVGLALAAVVAGCGGGGSSGGVVPGATPTPAAKVTYALRWTGVTHSSTSSVARSAGSSLRHALDVTSVSEPIELAVSHGAGSLIDGSGATGGVLQVVAVTSGGSPAPAVDPSQVTIANTALAVSTPLPAPSASPAAGVPLNVAAINSAATTGSTTLTATMPDGSTPTTAVDVYGAFTMECPLQHPDSVQAYKVVGHAIVTATGASDGDVYVTGTPACTDTSTSAIMVHFPYGYETFAESTPFSTIATALPFTSAGTTITGATIRSLVTNPTSPSGGFIFGTASGDYVKVRFSQAGSGNSGGTETFVMSGAAEVGPGGIFPL